MNNIETSTETPVLQYARHLLALHGLDLQGKHNSKEAEAIRDQMDAPWYAMTAQEQERMGGLSEDLYTLAKGGPPRTAMSEQEANEWKKELKERKERYLHGDIDGWLEFWRKPRPDDFPAPQGIPRSVVHFFQAQCWDRLKDSETAAFFMKEAKKEEPELSSLVMHDIRAFEECLEQIHTVRSGE